MQTLSLSDCDTIGGGNVYAAAGLLLAVIANAGAISDFCSGFLDGFHNTQS